MRTIVKRITLSATAVSGCSVSAPEDPGELQRLVNQLPGDLAPDRRGRSRPAALI